MKKPKTKRVRHRGERQTLAQFIADGGRIARCDPARAGSGRYDQISMVKQQRAPWRSKVRDANAAQDREKES